MSESLKEQVRTKHEALVDLIGALGYPIWATNEFFHYMDRRDKAKTDQEKLDLADQYWKVIHGHEPK